jgi:hypothetical protein
MSSKSMGQHNLMAGCAHGWHPKGVKCPPAKVAKEFSDADKGKHFANGGPVMNHTSHHKKGCR